MGVGERIRRTLEGGERVGWRLAAKAFFATILVSFIFVSVAANSILLAVMASLATGIMLRIILPDEEFQAWARSYATGEAGERWRRRWDRFKAAIARMIPL